MICSSGNEDSGLIEKMGKALVALTQRFTTVDTWGHGGDSKTDDAHRSVVEE